MGGWGDGQLKLALEVLERLEKRPPNAEDDADFRSSMALAQAGGGGGDDWDVESEGEEEDRTTTTEEEEKSSSDEEVEEEEEEVGRELNEEERERLLGR